MLNIDVKNIVYWMKIVSGVFQIGGVVVASLIDLKSKAVDLALESVPGNPALEEYNSIKGDGGRIPSEEELHYNDLASRDNPKRNAALFKLSIVMVGFGMALQLLADIIEPA
ncbi:hypothetical protein P0D91_05415 [Pseudomonas sp. CBSPBW29]|uniref:hypothetical protein n=1 Tax=Pseudomonas sp. CBS TaxID=2971912 RepID=UPI0021AD498A|nr:hypothetical protein [Pseudomonas sp. CBS]WEL43735.1 hypothetical protein P0D91_05415 [Pseudomonas sp. CBSPBW29]WEL64806.1 hypothetical protein P0D93_32965 [Pseudomonas sp. CBSPGW29]WEL68273.1 hypothetical protein P0D94_18870 [Pseudomonas sp. CBSPCGW29]WEL75295.1 hypothetical protein P0D92_24930 [Pseudomonas sp. CBSPAW29]WEL80463.1 hypothetical protein P0D95_20875 [Pseudomonas sp. CBSPCAW29]